MVAVVSGRPVEYLEAKLGRGGGLLLIGLYGMERVGPRGRTLDQSALAWRDVVASAADAAEAEAPPGVDIERKGLSVALHTRRHPEGYSWALGWASERAASTGLVAQEGRLVVELLPPVPTDKGTIVEELAASLEAVCFFGDDRGDLPAFVALGRLREGGKHTVSVGVASAEQPAGLAGAADLLVDGPKGALDLLAGLEAGQSSSAGGTVLRHGRGQPVPPAP